MAQFMHPNIVRVFGSVDQGKCYIGIYNNVSLRGQRQRW